ncbi:MAG: IPT/TIG domain-containing protein [Candidatus Sulfotelmatobacter sp.]
MTRISCRIAFFLLLSMILPASLLAAAPSITSLSPTSGAVGASVTITGTNFGSTQGTSTVKFNTTSWSATSIVAIVPIGATTGGVVVTVGGTASNSKTFTVVAAPSITSLSLTSGAVGAAVTITGTSFTSTKGTVTFNGVSASITSWAATSIKVTVPSGATTGNVVVFASGVYSNGVSFSVLPAPDITSLSPSSAAVGASVTISGTADHGQCGGQRQRSREQRRVVHCSADPDHYYSVSIDRRSRRVSDHRGLGFQCNPGNQHGHI